MSEARLGDTQFAESGRLSSALAMWLPLFFFGATLWIAQHDLEYASPDFTDAAVVDLTPTPARQLSFIVLGLFGVLALLKPSGVPRAINGRQLISLFSLCLFIVLSAFWSDEFELSLKRSLIPTIVLVAALGVAKHWHPYEACKFSLMLTSIFLLLGVGAEVASGKFMQGADYRFSGTLHPNNQGVNCAILCLASLALYRDPRQRKSRFAGLAFLLLFGLGMVFLFLTKSRTAAAAYLFALFFLLGMGMPRGKKMLAMACLAMISITGTLAVFAFGAGDQANSLFVEAIKMGREQETENLSSLTGRIPIWQEILRDVAERPLFGHGYGAFWTPHRVAHYSYIHDWEFTHAHSAYLETLLNLGIFGLVLGLLLLLPVIRSAERAFDATADCGYRFAAALLVMALVHGFADANFVSVGVEPALALICIAVVVLHGAPAADDDARPAIAGGRWSNHGRENDV